MAFRYELRSHQPLGNWTIYDDTGYVATVSSEEQGIQIIEGLILREFTWQSGLKPGCWHRFETLPEPGVTTSGWQMACLNCGGFMGAKPPTQQTGMPKLEFADEQ